MTKAELQAELDRMKRDSLAIAFEVKRLQDLNRLHERTLNIVETLSRKSSNYWSGS